MSFNIYKLFVRSNLCFCRSLGVLLYTLVYGAMPFDGSNFKRLVKQITTGDYYEPSSPACRNKYIFKNPFINVFFVQLPQV